MEKFLLISLNLNFTPNTLGSYGFKNKFFFPSQGLLPLFRAPFDVFFCFCFFKEAYVKLNFSFHRGLKIFEVENEACKFRNIQTLLKEIQESSG